MIGKEINDYDISTTQYEVGTWHENMAFLDTEVVPFLNVKCHHSKVDTW